MFVTEHAADACHIALDLIDASGGTLPAVRVGLASGEMASVFGDLYGPDVNLAARLVARGRTVDGGGVRWGPVGGERLPLRTPASSDVEGLRGPDDGLPARAATLT